MNLSPALTEYLSDRIPKVAKRAHERFPRVDREDFEQECWMRACVSADVLDKYLKQDNGPNLIWRKLQDYCHRYGMQDDRDRRARKAAAAGYSIHDEFFYTNRMLGLLVAELIQSEWDLTLASDRVSNGTDLAGVRIQDGDDAHDSYMDYMATLLDVKTAWGKLKKSQRTLLEAWYALGPDDYEDQLKWNRQAVAASMGLTYDALEQRKRRALTKLLHELGGESPWVKKSRKNEATDSA